MCRTRETHGQTKYEGTRSLHPQHPRSTIHCLLLVGWFKQQSREKKESLTHTGNTAKQTHTTSCVQSMLKSTSVLFSTFLLSKPIIVCLVWRRVVFFETPISSKSPSVVSHRPPPCLPSSCLPPCFPPPPLHLTLLHLDRKEFIAQLRSLLH